MSSVGEHSKDLLRLFLCICSEGLNGLHHTVEVISFLRVVACTSTTSRNPTRFTFVKNSPPGSNYINLIYSCVRSSINFQDVLCMRCLFHERCDDGSLVICKKAKRVPKTPFFDH